MSMLPVNTPSPLSVFSLDHLNEPQRQAAIKTDGVTLVIAGAGSGKTRVITSRIAHLITNLGVSSRSIIGLTFTNKAANEMKERIKHAIPDGSSLPFVGTFHSYCLLLLRMYRRFTGLETFTIIDAEDQKAILKKIIERASLEKRISATQAQYQISFLKNHSAERISQNVNPQMTLVREIAAEYEKEKQRSNALDFDDLMIKVLDLFKTNTEFKTHFQHTVKHILVDEYQDTNDVQHELLKQMAIASDGKISAHSVCAVGDEDQSIYSWRGAQVENMQLFKKDFAPVEIIKIEQNYRSVQPILQAANAVISHNRGRTPKTLWSEQEATDRIALATCKSAYQEAELICSALRTLPAHINRGSVAILYRTHAQTRVIEEILIQHSIPYTIFGGIRFYERKEIKDILAFLRLLANPKDRVSLLRVLNMPARGLGEKVEQLIADVWNENGEWNFIQVLNHLIANKSNFGLSRVHEKGLNEFISIFTGLSIEQNIRTIYEAIIERTEYFSYLMQNYERDEARTKTENLRELCQSIDNFEKNYQPEEDSPAALVTFLHEVALLQEKIADENAQTEMVKLMTLHSAKGLEFDLVVIAGLEETVLPSSRSIEERAQLEEERRLFYVGVTRARHYLILSHAHTRATYGSIADQMPSRFIKELPHDLLVPLDLTQMHLGHIDRTITAWFNGKPTASAMPTTFGLAPSHLPKARTREQEHPSNRSFIGNKTASSSPSPSKLHALQQLQRIQNKPATPVRNFVAGAKTTEKITPPVPANSPWKPHQKVSHSKFGIGTVVAVEHRQENEYFVTIKFATGTKTILSTFLTHA